MKNTKLNERLTIQFRAEFFNVLNRANLANPSTLNAIGSPLGGANAWLAGGGTANQGVTNSNFSQITTLYSQSRRLQFGLKLSF